MESEEFTLVLAPPLNNCVIWGGAPGWLSLFKHLTLDFGSGNDPRVVGSSPMSGSALSMELA